MQSKGKKIAILVGVVAVVVFGAAAWSFRASLRFWWLFESMGNNEQGFPEYRHRQTSIVFVYLPGGTFMMGSPETEEGREDDEGPVHKVKVSSFLIAKFEVKQSEWEAVMGSILSEFTDRDRPVHSVSWNDCQEFCAETGFKLPTEAQWEYACRARTTGPYAGTGNLEEIGWYVENSREWRTPHAVGQKRPNDFGLYDMHGNVWECCLDVFVEDFYSRLEATVKDPVCSSGSGDRVRRGGSWKGEALYCRSANRGRLHPSSRGLNLGFRPTWSPLP